MNDRPAVLDTSVLVARETGRRLNAGNVPDRAAVSVITVAELQVGVLATSDLSERARRLATLERIAAVEALPVTVDAARRWAEFRVRLAHEGRSAKVNDLWIAAVASSNGMDIVTQDEDFDVIESIGGPRVIRV